MFGLLNNLAHHCSVASFPPCWAVIPGTIPRPVDAELSCAHEGRPRSDVPSCRLSIPEHIRKRKKDEGKKRNCFSWWSKTAAKHCQSCGKNKREKERDGNESDQPTFSPLFPSFHLLCVFPLCCRQTALTNLWAWIRGCYILSPRRR